MSTIAGLVGSDLVDDVIAADAINDRILLLRRALEAVLAGRDRATVAEARMVAGVARLAETDRSVRRVEHLARAAGASVRTLQRLFGQHVGVSAACVIGRWRIIEAADAARGEEGSGENFAGWTTSPPNSGTQTRRTWSATSGSTSASPLANTSAANDDRPGSEALERRMTNQPRALVVGGTGPTGPAVVNGLMARGFAVTILHTGRHEVDSIPPEVEHLHTNPFQIDEVAATIGSRTFDVVYAMYGRLRDLAPYFVGRTGQFIAVGGVPAYHGFARPHQNVPAGMLVPIRESARRAGAFGAPDADENDKVAKIVATEDVVFEHHPDATLFRYPLIYGPGQINPREWLIVRRILDGRRRIIVADGGLTLRTAAFGANAGHALSLCVERPDAAAGKVYNISDAHVLTAAQTIEVIAAALDTELEIVNLPADLATPARPFLAHEHTWHQFTGVDRLIHDLGYVDTLPAVDAIAFTARHLAANPVERGSKTEMRLQDPFDYAAEDAIIDAYHDAVGPVEQLAAAYDPEFRDRYAPGSDDWRLVPPRS